MEKARLKTKIRVSVNSYFDVYTFLEGDEVFVLHSFENEDFKGGACVIWDGVESITVAREVLEFIEEDNL